MRKFFLYKACKYLRQATELNNEKMLLLIKHGSGIKKTLTYQSIELAEALANFKYNICVSFLPTTTLCVDRSVSLKT